MAEEDQANMYVGGEDDDMFFEEGALVEVDVGDEPILEDDEEGDDDDIAFAEEDQEMEEGAEEPDLNIVDMSAASCELHTDSVYCTAFHPSQAGLMISGGGDDRAFMWRYDTAASRPDEQSTDMEDTPEAPAKPGKNITWFQELSGHSDTVTSVGFNFDGTLALTGGYDGIVNIWNVASGELLLALEGPEDVEFACWHSKGNAVLAGSKDGTIWMWLAQTGQCVQVFAGHDGGVSCGLFTVDGKNVCSGGEDGTVRIWGPKTGACKHVFSGSSGGHQAPVTALANSADGELLLSGGMDGEVRLFHIQGKRMLQVLVHSSPEKIDTPDEAGEASAAGVGGRDGGEGSDDEEEEEEEEVESVKAVECVGFAAKELKWLASGGADFTLKIWDINTGTCRCVCRHEDSVVTLQWHATLPVVVTGCLDFNVRVWDARSGACVSVFSGHRDLVTNLKFRMSSSAEEADAIASVSDDGTIKLFQFDTQRLLLA